LVRQLRLEAATAQVTFVASPSPERGETTPVPAAPRPWADRMGAHRKSDRAGLCRRAEEKLPAFLDLKQ
jgi:hypothetical protein